MKSRLGLMAVAAAAWAMPLGSFADACLSPNSAALLILDASYSMLRILPDGKTRFADAREAIAAAVDLFPDDGLVALRLYGSQSQVIRNDCQDTVLAVPFAPASTNRSNIRTALAEAHARGVTPIAYSLQQAALDFTSNAIQRTIIMVSDGGETCEGNACAIAAQLGSQGYAINTIGFMTSGLPRAELRCIAAASGGDYFDVQVAVQLKDRLVQALGECPVAVLPDRPRQTGGILG